MSGPDPVRDREGIDIGFLERRRPGRRERTGQQMRSRRPWTGAARAGARDVPDHTRRARRGEPSRHARGRLGAEARECAGETRRPTRFRADPGAVRAHRRGAPGRRRRARPGPGRARPWHGGPGPHPISRPSSSAGRSIRSRGCPRSSRCCCGGSASTGSTAPIPTIPWRGARTVYWVAGVLVILYAIDSGLALYDTTLFSLHMVQHLLLTLVAPPLLLHGRADHAPPPGVHARHAPPVHPPGPALAADATGVVPRRRMGGVRGRDVGEPLLAAVQPGPRGSMGPSGRARCCSWRRRCCSGGRSSAPTRRHGSSSRPPASCTSASRCPRTRSSPSRSTWRRRRSTPTTSTNVRTWGPTRARGPAAGRRLHVVRGRPDLHRHGRPARPGSGCGPRSAATSARTAGSRQSVPPSASARSGSRLVAPPRAR